MPVKKSPVKKTRRNPRKYNGVLNFFHNYEHNPSGLNHCKSAGNFPYTIEHVKGKHKISHRLAIGHGIGCKPQAFKFTKRLGNGYDMASGVKITMQELKAMKVGKK